MAVFPEDRPQPAAEILLPPRAAGSRLGPVSVHVWLGDSRFTVTRCDGAGSGSSGRCC